MYIASPVPAMYPGKLVSVASNRWLYKVQYLPSEMISKELPLLSKNSPVSAPVAAHTTFITKFPRSDKSKSCLNN